MKKIAKIFKGFFRSWHLELPQEHIDNRQRWEIRTIDGLFVQYLFGKGKSGEFLDVYATHRMTNDRHARIYENGKTKTLPAISQFRKISSDPQKDLLLEKQRYVEEEKVIRMLKRKGFYK